MIKRFDCGAAIAAITPKVFLLYDGTDNPTYYNRDGTSPVIDQEVREFVVTADAACKVEIGTALADRSSFLPAYTTYATLAKAGGIVRKFDVSSLGLVLSATQLLALRVSVTADATVNVAGDATMHRA